MDEDGMKKKKIKFQEIIAEELDSLIDRLGKDDGDKSYIAYILFSICGSLLLLHLGEEKFDKFVSDIKEKASNHIETVDSVSMSH